MTEPLSPAPSGTSTSLLDPQAMFQRLQASLAQAAEAAVFSRGTTFPALRFLQGGRAHYVTAAALQEIPMLFRPGVTPEEAAKLEEPTNRPVDSDHVKHVADYIVNNAPPEGVVPEGAPAKSTYVLGPILGAVDLDIVQFFPVFEHPGAKIALGFLFLPVGHTFEVTDGQHRRDGISQALKSKKSIERDSIGLELIHETDPKRRRLDFADLSKTKAIGNTILSWFDVRDKLAELCVDLVSDSKFLKDRVDRFKEKVTGRSQKLYTMNQVLTFCGAALDPKIRVGKDAEDMRVLAREFIYDDETYGRNLHRILTFLDTVASLEATLKKLVDDIAKPKAEQFSARQVYDLIDNHLLGTWSGLYTIGVVCARSAGLTHDEQRMVAEALAKLDWSYSSKMWIGSLLTGPDKLSGSAAAPNRGADRAVLRLIVEREKLGIPREVVDKLQLDGSTLLELAEVASHVLAGTFSEAELTYIRERLRFLYGSDAAFNALKPAQQEIVRAQLQEPVGAK